jgi:hypothetical protein
LSETKLALACIRLENIPNQAIIADNVD